MELFTNNYTSHDYSGAIAIICIFVPIGLIGIGYCVYKYYSIPNVPVDPVLNNLSNGVHSELRFAHSDIELNVIANSVIEREHSLELIVLLLAILLLLLIYFIVKKYK